MNLLIDQKDLNILHHCFDKVSVLNGGSVGTSTAHQAAGNAQPLIVDFLFVVHINKKSLLAISGRVSGSLIDTNRLSLNLI